MSNEVKPQVTLPLTEVIPSTTPHHVSHDVIEEAIKQGEDVIKELSTKFKAGQENMQNILKQQEETKKYLDTIQINATVVKSQVDAFKEALKKIKDLEISEH